MFKKTMSRLLLVMTVLGTLTLAERAQAQTTTLIYPPYGSAQPVDAYLGYMSLFSTGNMIVWHNKTTGACTVTYLSTPLSNSIYVYGSSGNDSLIVLSGPTSVYCANLGTVNLAAFRQNSGVILGLDGMEGDDLIVSGQGQSFLAGNLGNDRIFNYSQDFRTLVQGNAGNDTIFNYGSAQLLNGGAGDDCIQNSGQAASVNCADGNDRMAGTAGATYLCETTVSSCF